MKIQSLFLAAAVALAGFAAEPVCSGTHFAADALKPFVESGELPGAISVFYQNGKQEVACVGYADVAKKRPITLDDPYMQCSQTKGFCGVTIAILVEEGKISLDDPVSKYLPEFGTLWVKTSEKDGVRTLTKAKNVLTVRMCLNHTGGFEFELPNYQAMGHDGVESVIYTLLNKYPQLDPSRVYAEGLSAGSMTATALGIKKSHVFAAVGGHSGALFGGLGMGAFPGFTSIWNEATQKRGAIETAYCSVFGTMDTTVPYMTKDNWKGNSYLNAWNAYEQMNGMEVVSEMDFDVDPVFGQKLRDRETVKTAKGEGIVMEMGQLYKGNTPLIKMVAVIDYGHWNFMPTARVMWDFFKQYRRDPETKKLIYTGK